jgi:hypothetical protein
VRAYSSEKLQTVHHTRQARHLQAWALFLYFTGSHPDREKDDSKLPFASPTQNGPTQQPTQASENKRSEQGENQAGQHQEFESARTLQPVEHGQHLRVAGL